MAGVHATASRGFGADADTYARGRPDYPREVLDWLTGDLRLVGGSTALELGAGTGKFTKSLTQTGADVIAVEPVAAMVARLAAEQPGVRTVEASAQDLPLPDGSVDAVICAQSFHWFATPESLSEIRRVLKPGGTLGLIWNVRDQSIDWVAQLTRIMAPYEGDAPRYDHGEWRRVFPAPGFGPLRQKSVAHAHTGPASRVIVDRIASVSFIAALPPEQRQSVIDELHALIAATPELAGKEEVSLPYITWMYWCHAEDTA
jgi:SAM-dependent methyltransferase